mgnify:CR=1 FL=1|jgi:hypothetical protein
MGHRPGNGTGTGRVAPMLRRVRTSAHPPPQPPAVAGELVHQVGQLVVGLALPPPPPRPRPGILPVLSHGLVAMRAPVAARLRGWLFISTAVQGHSDRLSSPSAPGTRTGSQQGRLAAIASDGCRRSQPRRPGAGGEDTALRKYGNARLKQCFEHQVDDLCVAPVGWRPGRSSDRSRRHRGSLSPTARSPVGVGGPDPSGSTRRARRRDEPDGCVLCGCRSAVGRSRGRGSPATPDTPVTSAEPMADRFAADRAVAATPIVQVRRALMATDAHGCLRYHWGTTNLIGKRYRISYSASYLQ